MIQFESIPFHSVRLPGIRQLSERIETRSILKMYAQHLGELLKRLPVIALSAASSKVSITPRLIGMNPWLTWQAKLMGLETAALKIQPLVRKHRKVTSAFVYARHQGRISGFVLMMGGNHFPGDEGREKLANVLAGR